MTQKVGLSVQEGVASGITPFVESSKHNIAAVWERERGVPNRVTRVDSLQEDYKRFGGLNANMFGPYVARNLYANVQNFGAVVYGLRILDEDNSQTATGTLTDGAPATQTLTITNVATQQNSEDNLTLTGTSGTFNITINGTDYLATFNTDLDTTGDDFVSSHAAAILADTDLVVTNNSGVLNFDGPTDYPITISAALTGDLNATAAAVTEAAAQVDNIIPANPNEGDQFDLTIGGDTVSFTCTEGTVANVVDGLFAAIAAEITASPGGAFDLALASYTKATDSAYIIATAPDGTTNAWTTATTNGASNSILVVWAGQEGEKDPGDWANDMQVNFYPKNHENGVLDAYLIEVVYGGSVVESFVVSDWDSAITKVNEQSTYVMFEVFGAGSTLHPIYDLQTVTLAGGVYAAPSESDAYPATVSDIDKGLRAFDGFDVQLFISTEYQSTTMAVQGRDYCAARAGGDALFISITPYLASDTTIEAFSTALQEAGPSHCAHYDIWARTSDGRDGSVWVPAYGQIIGAGFIRTPQLQRDHIWIPPAGVDSIFRDTIDIAPNPLSVTKIDTRVTRNTTNVAKFLKGSGFFLYSSRTMATNSLYHSIHIRRMTGWITTTLLNSLSFALQKPNSPELRRELIVSITTFFRGIYNSGGLERTIPFEEAFQVICDKTNNPSTQDRKTLNIDVEWIPVEATEAVVLRLNRNDGSLLVTEIEQ